MPVGNRIVQSEKDHVATHVSDALAQKKGLQQDAAFQAQADYQARLSIARAAIKAGKATAAQRQLVAYTDDGAFLANGVRNSSKALNESYYQYLPPLVRGHVVPAGYPAGRTGLIGYTTYAPRIVGISPNSPTTVQIIDLTQLRLAAPPAKSMSVAAFLKYPGTTMVEKDVTWWNQKLGMYATYKPHLLFDHLYQKEKAFADPADPFWQNKFDAWNEIPLALAFGRFLAGVILIIGCAYAIGAAGIDGSASAGAGAGATGGTAAGGAADTTAASDVAAENAPQVAFTGQVAGPVSTVDTGIASDTIPELSAADLAAPAGASALSDIAGAAATDLVKVGTAAVVGDIAKSTLRPAPATPATPATPTVAGDVKGAAPSNLKQWLLLGLAAAAAFAVS